MMVPEVKLNAFLKLQEFILENQDSAHLISNLFNFLLPTLSISGLNYQFGALALLDLNGALQESYFTEANSTSNLPLNFVHWLQLFQSNSKLSHEILWDKVFITKDIPSLLAPTYPNLTKIKACIIAPLLTNHKLEGVLVLGSSIEISQVDADDLEVIQMTTHLINLAYRLQDTQTSLTKITQEVYKMNVELHQLDDLKDDFVSIASHELRTPMTAIRSYVWMSLHRSDITLSEKLKRYLYRTLISTERLINLVNDMLNISRIESGKIEIIPKTFDIISLVDDVVIEVTPKAKERNLQINITKTQVPQVFADEDKIRQVILNLIGNSLKFTPVDGNIDISFFSDGQTVSVIIKDNGVGILKDDLQRLFKKFGRLDNSYVAAASSGGTGLGLFISKKLVELMGGTIKGESEGINKGSTFTFTLPAATPKVLQNAYKYTKKVIGETKFLEPVAI